MITQYDLHAHSTASDGTLSPTVLMQQAAAAGVQVMALTDHDTLAGIDEAQTAAETCGLQFVPGVEISVTWQRRTVHIVGLGVDSTTDELQTGLASLREFRVWRAQEMGRGLAKAGITGMYERANELASGGLVSRTHFARALVELGYANNVSQVFKKYLVNNKPGHVTGKWATLENALDWIHTAGGQAVIAHPARYRMTRSKLRQLIQDFVDCGGQAIEVVSGSHSRDDMFTIAQHARDFNLLASAGSDYHGPEHTWMDLGKLPALPDGCTPVWQHWKLA
jgi:predicted metal-dependent phosphoesterase TrpH